VKTAVIVTTYNRPDALAAVLEGYGAQAHRDFELLIADDGSTDETRNLVETFAAEAPFPMRHVWQEDRGMLLSERFTAEVLRERLPIHEWSTRRWLIAWVRREVNRALPLAQLPDGPLRKRDAKRWEGVKTCNLSAWRDDLVRVNGFDERYSGWGLEDSDLVIRLVHAGVRHKSARFAAPVFHLWHRENDRMQLDENQRRLDEIIASNRIAAAVGLDQYS
jgi:glycosyltransferase involved in cell wall biosynthesis